MTGFSKKKPDLPVTGCCCGADASPAKASEQDCGIKVLGGGCCKCHELQENVRAALAEMGRNDEVMLITDPAVIASFGVMSTPALVVNCRVVSFGRVLKTAEAKKLLEEALKTCC